MVLQEALVVRTALIAALLFSSPVWAQSPKPMDLAPFGELASFGEKDEINPLAAGALAKAGLPNAGLYWREERDVNEIRVRYAAAPPRNVVLQYWFHTWPFHPPQMPSIEDPVDDRWQGKWLTASIQPQCSANECVYRFAPIAEAENPNAKYQPGLTYRRTLKVRLAVPNGTLPAIQAIHAFSGTTEKPLQVRVALGYGEKAKTEWSGSVQVQNGRVESAKPWQFTGSDRVSAARAAASSSFSFVTSGTEKGVDLNLTVAEPSLPGSLDETLVSFKVKAKTADGVKSRSFTFRVADLKSGPIYIPDFKAYATTDLSKAPFAPPAASAERIRTMIPREPEQSMQRATSEIPKLDPWERQWGGRLYYPLGPDGSWQKFAFEIGGNPYISKSGAKTMGRELKRVLFDGDRLTWKIGTGSTPYYRDDQKATIEKLDGYLPVGIQKWESDGFAVEQEGFATVLHGPMDALDPKRDEQTPAVLMITMRYRNTTNAARDAHLWLHTDPQEELSLKGGELYATGGATGTYGQPRLRALLKAEAQPLIGTLPGGSHRAAHVKVPVAAGATATIIIKLPFVSDLTPDQIAEMSRLDLKAEREKVIAFWRKVTDDSDRFTVPEERFNLLSRSITTHIRLSATKDPVSGHLMLPAASYIYEVYANETCFQTLLLDSLGQHKLAEAYLEPLLQYQGTRTFPGKHEGKEDGIFHGVKVAPDYDYTASTYGLDHGTVLWTLGEHYLYTRDRQWFEHAWPHMAKAIDWIITQRHKTMLRDVQGEPVPEYGLLPASSLEDNSDWAHWFANNSFSWAGLDRAAQALADLKHPEAARIRKEADAFKHDLREAVLRAAGAASVTRLRDGSYTPWVPVEPYQRTRRFGPIRVDYYKRYGITEQPNLRLSAIREVLYGPIILLNLGVFDVDEPIANWILDDWEDNETLTSGLGLNVHGLTDDKLWFSQGGMVFQSNLQNPLLVYLKRHDTPAAIRSAYNNFVACFYSGPNVFTEEYRAWAHPSGPFFKSPDESKFVNRLRDMLVLEEGDTLWLADGAPQRWFTDPEGMRVDRVGTYFGDLSYSLKQQKPGLLEGEVTLPSRNPARQALLRVRLAQGTVQAVRIDGQNWADFDAKQGTIRLPKPGKTVKLEIEYR